MFFLWTFREYLSLFKFFYSIITDSGKQLSGCWSQQSSSVIICTEKQLKNQAKWKLQTILLCIQPASIYHSFFLFFIWGKIIKRKRSRKLKMERGIAVLDWWRLRSFVASELVTTVEIVWGSLFINSSEFQSFSPLEDTPRDKINNRAQSAILKTRSRELKQKGSQL